MSLQAKILNSFLTLCVKPQFKYYLKRYYTSRNINDIYRVRKKINHFPVFRSSDAHVKSITLDNIPALQINSFAVPPTKTILYLHGGAYVAGSPKIYSDLAYRLAVKCSATVFVIEYRLAPEHPFPCALEDVLKVYRWLCQHHTTPDHLIVMGDSAGGGLTLAMLVALKNHHERVPAVGVCLSAWTDLALTGHSIKSNEKKDPLLVLSPYPIPYPYVGSYDPCHPLISPLYADLTGLPPLMMQVSHTEILLDDTLRVAEKAQAAGVDVVLDVWENLPHVWPLFARWLPEGRAAIENIGNFINQRVSEA